MRILGLIPARGGSKGIKDKNITELAGRPLIQYTIDAALKVSELDRIWVSTDSEDIKKVSEECGIEVPFLRPAHLAGDHTRTIEVVLDLLDQLEKEFSETYDFICLLQPTSPLRRSQDIINCIELIQKEETDSVVSLTRIDEPHPHKMKVIENGRIKPYLKGTTSSVPRQELPPVYELNGAIYLTYVEALRKNQSFFTDKSIPYIMPEESSVNINSSLDLILAEALINLKGQGN